MPFARGLIVEIALTPAATRSALASFGFDAVLCDYQLAAETADELLGELAAAFPKVRRVLWSGADPVLLDSLCARGLVHSALRKSSAVEDVLSALTVAK